MKGTAVETLSVVQKKRKLFYSDLPSKASKRYLWAEYKMDQGKVHALGCGAQPADF